MAGVVAVAWLLVMVTGSLAVASPVTDSGTATRNPAAPIRAAFYYPGSPRPNTGPHYAPPWVRI